jgi:hypothetical protein
MSASPRVERVGDLVLVSGYRPSDAMARSPDGGTVAIAARDAFRGDVRPLGTWVIDLAEARVVTFVPAPGGLRSIELLDATPSAPSATTACCECTRSPMAGATGPSRSRALAGSPRSRPVRWSSRGPGD